MDSERKRSLVHWRLMLNQSEKHRHASPMMAANSLARSLPEGVEDSFWEVQKAFLANNAQKIKTDLLSKQSSLSAGQAPKPEDPESKQIAAFRQAMGLK